LATRAPIIGLASLHLDGKRCLACNMGSCHRYLLFILI